MCTCASCEYTDRFGGMPDLFGAPVTKDHHHGWEWWPRGDPQGKRASAADYASHVSHGKAFAGMAKAIPPALLTLHPEPRFSCPGLVPPLGYPSALVRQCTDRPIPPPRIRLAPRLVQMARDLRRQAGQQRRAA